MKTAMDYVREIHPDKKCPCCGVWLNFRDTKSLASAYVNDMWYCGGCGADVRELIYGKQINRVASKVDSSTVR